MKVYTLRNITKAKKRELTIFTLTAHPSSSRSTYSACPKNQISEDNFRINHARIFQEYVKSFERH